MLPETVLFAVDLRSIAYSELADTVLSVILFWSELTVIKPFTMLFVKVVFNPEIVTVVKTVLSVATTFLPLIVNDLAVLLMNVEPSVTRSSQIYNFTEDNQYLGHHNKYPSIKFPT